MENPNNCETCDYKKLNGNREKGWCYMFRDEPNDVCMAHTGRKPMTAADCYDCFIGAACVHTMKVPNACGEPGLTEPGKD